MQCLKWNLFSKIITFVAFLITCENNSLYLITSKINTKIFKVLLFYDLQTLLTIENKFCYFSLKCITGIGLSISVDSRVIFFLNWSSLAKVSDLNLFRVNQNYSDSFRYLYPSQCESFRTNLRNVLYLFWIRINPNQSELGLISIDLDWKMVSDWFGFIRIDVS